MCVFIPLTRKISNQRASLIVEALLTIMILSVVLTMVIRSIVSAARASSYTADYTIGLTLLENALFEARRDAMREFDQSREGDFKRPFDGYRYQIRGNALDEGKLKNLFASTAAVSWGVEGRKRNLSMDTFMLKRDIE